MKFLLFQFGISLLFLCGKIVNVDEELCDITSFSKHWEDDYEHLSCCGRRLGTIHLYANGSTMPITLAEEEERGIRHSITGRCENVTVPGTEENNGLIAKCISNNPGTTCSQTENYTIAVRPITTEPGTASTDLSTTTDSPTRSTTINSHHDTTVDPYGTADTTTDITRDPHAVRNTNGTTTNHGNSHSKSNATVVIISITIFVTGSVVLIFTSAFACALKYYKHQRRFTPTRLAPTQQGQLQSLHVVEQESSAPRREPPNASLYRHANITTEGEKSPGLHYTNTDLQSYPSNLEQGHSQDKVQQDNKNSGTEGVSEQCTDTQNGINGRIIFDNNKRFNV